MTSLYVQVFSCSKQYSSVKTYMCNCKPYYQPLDMERNVTGKCVVQNWNIPYCSCTEWFVMYMQTQSALHIGCNIVISVNIFNHN